MIKPTIPHNDDERIESLYAYYVKGQQASPAFKEIVQLTAEICEVPISLITVVGKNKQFHKAKYGIEVESIDRDESFCAHSIETPNELLVVKDARIDDRFKDNPLVTGSMEVVFYAGKPIINANGHFMGSLCVLDNKPRELKQHQVKALESLAKQAARLFHYEKTVNLQNERKMVVEKSRSLNSEEVTSALEAQMGKIDKMLEILGKSLGE